MGTGTAIPKANFRVTVVRAGVTRRRLSRAVMEILHREVGTVARRREDTVGPKEGTVGPREDTVARSRVGMVNKESGVANPSKIGSVGSPGREAGSKASRVAVAVAVVAAARVLKLSQSAGMLAC